MTGCENSADRDVAVAAMHLEDVELEPITNSTLVLCGDEEAETILTVTISARPHWPGYTGEFPLKKPSTDDDGWKSSPYVCSIGPHGFYGSVSIGDADDESMPISVSLTYDHPTSVHNKLTDKFDVPLSGVGETSLANNWLASWSWKDPATKSGRTIR